MSTGLEQAIALHRAGQLDDAERGYRDILLRSPDDHDALHLLGVLRHQKNDPAEAAALIARAIALNPGAPAFHYDLGIAEAARGRSDQAIAAFRRELELYPDYAPARRVLVAAQVNSGA